MINCCKREVARRQADSPSHTMAHKSTQTASLFPPAPNSFPPAPTVSRAKCPRHPPAYTKQSNAGTPVADSDTNSTPAPELEAGPLLLRPRSRILHVDGRFYIFRFHTSSTEKSPDKLDTTRTPGAHTTTARTRPPKQPRRNPDTPKSQLILCRL